MCGGSRTLMYVGLRRTQRLPRIMEANHCMGIGNEHTEDSHIVDCWHSFVFFHYKCFFLLKVLRMSPTSTNPDIAALCQFIEHYVKYLKGPC